MKIGILPLGRPTFDVPFAEENLSAMLAALDATGQEILGPRELLFDGDATEAAINDLQSAGIDFLLLMQVTFTDASMTVAAANAFDTPIGIWAIPEPRIGGRLRLSSFCGLNLASHALGLNRREFSWLYADPSGDAQADLAAMFAGDRTAGHLEAQAANGTSDKAKEIVSNVTGRRIARLGEHPVGFDTCAYDDGQLKALAGVEVDALALDDLFEAGRQADAGAVATLKEQTKPNNRLSHDARCHAAS